MALIQKDANADLITLAAKSSPIAFYATDQAAEDAYTNGEIPEGTIVFTEEDASKFSDQWKNATGITYNTTYVNDNYANCSVRINRRLGLAVCTYSFQLKSYPPVDAEIWTGLPKADIATDFQSPIQAMSISIAMRVTTTGKIIATNLNEGSFTNKWVAGSFTYVLAASERE